MKTALDPRHLRREKVIQELFAWQEQQKVKAENVSEMVADRDTWDEKTEKIIKTVSQIDELIRECAPEWEIDKINQIDLAILRLAIFELAIEANEPAKAIIDEAVELAKEYGTETSSSFVNGALGKAVISPQRILKVIANRLGAREELTRDTPISELNVEGLELDDLLTFLENEFKVKFPPKSQIEFIGDIIDVIEDAND